MAWDQEEIFTGILSEFAERQRRYGDGEEWRPTALVVGRARRVRVRKSMAGRESGRLVVLDVPPGRNSQRRLVWTCLCSPDRGGCGETTLATTHDLTTGNKQSCGCAQRQHATKHASELNARRAGRKAA